MEPSPPPYRAYAAIVGTFVAGLGAVSGLAAARRRPVQEISAVDLALLGLATFKASRTLARDTVTSLVRDPFLEGVAYEGENEQPTHETELKRAIGELVTCKRCIGTWIGAGLASTQILAPRTGRRPVELSSRPVRGARICVDASPAPIHVPMQRVQATSSPIARFSSVSCVGCSFSPS